MDGIILINKEKNCTSHDVVYKIKKMFGEKVGHAGTLDPMATGVLPLLIGKGTLCSKYLINHDKIYKVKLQLGKKTTTADAEGEVIEKQIIENSILEKENVLKILQSFKGKQKQVPPMYSAIKVNGKKLYEYARKGQKIIIEPRDIEIYDIELLDIDSKLEQIDFEVKCSKGTYIRSLCEDIAVRLGTVGYMAELQRKQVGIFNLKDTITVEELKNIIENNQNAKDKTVACDSDMLKSKYFIPIEKFFEEKDKIILDDRKLQLFLNGVKLTFDKPNGVYRIYNKDFFIGVGTIEKNILKRDIVV